MDDLYGLLYLALWAVIIGVVIEEWSLLWKVWKFTRLIWLGEYRSAFARTWEYKGELVTSLGFIILCIGLAAELLLNPLIEARQKSDQDTAASQLGNATSAAAKLGVTLDTLDKFVRDRQVQAELEVAALKETEATLDAAIKRANERLAPRDLLGDKLNAFISLLSRFGGSTIDIWVSDSGDVQESVNLGRVLFNALLKAGWDPALEVGVILVAPGTTVKIRKLQDGVDISPELQEKASTLLKSLADAELGPYLDIVRNAEGPYGFVVSIRKRAGDPSPLILTIGPKPALR